MELTGKCKDDFEEWFLLNNGLISLSETYLEEFNEYPENMKIGVYVDFFDENKIHLDVVKSLFSDNLYLSSVNDLEGIHCKTLQEARKAAINKANEIYNSN